MTQWRWVAVAVGSVLWAVAALAEDELARLEQEYLPRKAALERPVLTAHLEKLKTLHEAARSKRDVAKAEALRQEIERVTARLNASEIPTAADPPPSVPISTITLNAANAVLSGGAVVDPTLNARLLLEETDAQAEWKIPPLQPGRYQLKVSLGCMAGVTAKVALTLGARAPQTFTIAPTGATMAPVSLHWGEVDFSTPPESLKLRVTSSPTRSKPGKGWALYGFIIEPVTPSKRE